MKKILTIITVTCITIGATSCAEKFKTTVTVVGKSKDIYATVNKFYTGDNTYDAKTASGETVRVSVSEKMILNNKLPFKGTMEKINNANTGVITEVIK